MFSILSIVILNKIKFRFLCIITLFSYQGTYFLNLTTLTASPPSSALQTDKIFDTGSLITGWIEHWFILIIIP